MSTSPEYRYTDSDMREAFVAGAFTGHCVPMSTTEQREKRAVEWLERFKETREKQRQKKQTRGTV